MASNRQLIMVANRLPIRRMTKQGRGGWALSPGGLVSALRPILRDRNGVWIGWTGQNGPAPEPFTHDQIDMIPVRITRREADDYYWGFSNRTLWPLYHDAVRWPEYHREWWRGYVAINQRFAETVAEVAAKRAMVWVHDYHLQMVPGMLRKLRPDLRIGLFLHIPFPPAELFAQLPWRSQILEGMNGADLIGFQTALGAANFRRLSRRYTDAIASGNDLKCGSHRARVRHFPISVDYAALDAMSRSEACRAAAFRQQVRVGMGRRVLLGVDRLDYTKGIDIRLKAYRELLKEGRLNPSDTLLVQVAVPSREEVIQYQDIRAEVEQLVGSINGQYESIGKSAVHYLHRSLPHDQLVPLYAIADVMLVTPLRDGMNLVAKEYVSCRSDEDGVLLLSEFTGASKELRQAVQVNPHDVDGMKDAIMAALEMKPAERRRRMRALRRVVRQHDVYAWSDRFLECLSR